MLQCYLTTFQITYTTIIFLALYGLDQPFTHLLHYLFNIYLNAEMYSASAILAANI